MPSLAQSRSQELGETNQRLHFWLGGITAECGPRPVAAPDCIPALLSELLSAGAALRAEPLPARGTDPELDEEVDEYRRNLHRLRELLPSIHGHLLAERARLEAQRERVQSAAQWARTSRQTL